MAEGQQEFMGPVSGSVWVPPPGWEESLPPSYQNALKYLREQGKSRLETIRQEEMSPSTDSLQPSTQQENILLIDEPHDLGDYQMQLMMLERQNQKIHMMARQQQDPMSGLRRQSTPQMTPESRRQSVDSVWSTQFTPESSPDFQETTKIQEKCEFGRSPARLVPGQVSQPSCHCAASGQMLQDPGLQVAMFDPQKQAREIMARQKERWQSWMGDQQKRQELEIERQGKLKENLEKPKTAPSQPDNHALQSYQMQLMLLEQQNKERLMAGVAKTQKQNAGLEPPQPPNSNLTRRDYEMQLMLLEQQNKKRILTARLQEAQPSRSTKPTTGQDSDAGQKDDGPVCAAGGSRSNIMHSKPLVIRERRPTCDD
jgi:hypothetical protein